MSESGNGATENVPAGPGDQRLTPILAKEILSAKAVLPDLPSKKNGTQYESWRDTVTEDLKTSIYAITKDTQGGKELFKHLCELIQPQNPDTTFPDIDNLGLLLANLHVAVRKCVHKLEDSQPLLDAIKDANIHSEKATGLSNGILSLRALDGHFLKRAVLQRKDGLKKFQHATQPSPHLFRSSFPITTRCTLSPLSCILPVVFAPTSLTQPTISDVLLVDGATCMTVV